VSISSSSSLLDSRRWFVSCALICRRYLLCVVVYVVSFAILCCVDSLEGCDDDDQRVKAATIAAQYSLQNYG